MYDGSHKNIAANVLNTDNNKKNCFISPKSTYQNDSEESCDAEDWSNGCWEFYFAITEINYISEYIKIL